MILTRKEARARTRERLLNAAHTVFNECGFGPASIDRITTTAGYTRGAFYSNFDDKLDLLVALLGRDLERLRNEAVALTATGGMKRNATEMPRYDLSVLSDQVIALLWIEAALVALRDGAFRQRFSRMLQERLTLSDEIIGHPHGQPAVGTGALALELVSWSDASELYRRVLNTDPGRASDGRPNVRERSA